ncbi:MAG: hypothetical protein L3J71_04110 [Victivallaceae bacterium]|nr:hypothetical protein [Victivallaceae bacterium]
MQTIIFKSVELTLKGISYEVDYNETSRVALITPVINAIAACEVIILVSLDVDGHELLAPRRITFPSGTNKVRLNEVKIINPLNRQPRTLAHRNYAYRMAFKLATISNERKFHASNLVI